MISDLIRFYTEVSHLKEDLNGIVFSIKLIDACVKTALNIFLHTPVILSVKKKDLFFVLPYLGNLFVALRTLLQESISKDLPYCKIKLFLIPQHVFQILFDLKIKCVST